MLRGVAQGKRVDRRTVVLLGAVDLFGTMSAGRQVCRFGVARIIVLDASSPPARRAVLDAVLQPDRLR